MKEKLIAWMNSRRYNSHLMRLLVGGYVVYMGIKILLNLGDAGAFPIPLTLCAGLLILLGLPVVLVSLYACLYGFSAEYQGKPDFWKGRPPESGEEESGSENSKEI